MQLKRTDTLRKESEDREAAQRRAYDVIADQLSASEIQRQGLTLHTRVRELIDGECFGHDVCLRDTDTEMLLTCRDV